MKYEQFKLIIYKLSNIDLNCYKERQMKRRIDTFIKKNNYKEYGDFLQALRENEELYSEFLSYITINVSEFFRKTLSCQNICRKTKLEYGVVHVLLEMNHIP